MSENANDGGPAFPNPATYHPNGQIEYGTFGMSLLDYYAARCPLTLEESAHIYGAGIHGILREGGTHQRAFFAMDAEMRYEWAETMLAARAKRGDK